LHADRFRIQRRLEEWVEDPNGDPTASQFDARGESDRSGACDQDIGVDCVSHAAIIEAIRCQR
jgi:hypothetical protein